MVMPFSSTQPRVSIAMRSPRSNRLDWRSISNSIARKTARKLFMFLTSTFVPKALVPTGRRLTFASQRNDPSSMLPVETPRYWRIER